MKHDTRTEERAEQLRQMFDDHVSGKILFLDLVFQLIDRIEQEDVEAYNAAHPKAAITLSMFG